LATPRLYDRVVEILRGRHYSRRTEEAYVHRIRRFILFHTGRRPRELGQDEVNRFLTHLAVKENVAASTQNQALAGLLSLYEHVLEQPLNRMEGVVRARRPKRLPAVLTREVEAVVMHLEGVAWLACTLLYGSGMRLFEGLGLRVKDLNCDAREIIIRDGKGRRDRVTMLPDALRQPFEAHREQHQVDLKAGLGRTPLPEALARKYPNADREWGWQWVFPASSHYLDRQTGIQHRHHLHESVIQKAVHEASRRAGLAKAATPHSFRHYAAFGIGDILLPPTCSKTGTTSGRFRNCSGIGM
jgi:integron integrase